MIDITIHDIEGRIVQVMTLRNVTEANQNAGDGLFWVPGTAGLITDMVDVVEGTILPRPVPPGLPVSGVAPLVIDLSVYPAGTVITARNPEGDVIEITDLSEPLTLIDAGSYHIAVAPPWPHMPLAQDVEVADA